MKKKILIWVIIIVCISGWIAFFIEYGISYEKIKHIKAKNLELTSRLKYVKSVSQNLNATISIIDKTIGDLQQIKTGLIGTKKRLEIVGNTGKTINKKPQKK